MTILLVIAMEAEAAPVRAALGLEGPGQQLHLAFPAHLWATPDEEVAVASNGTDARFGVAAIATQPAVTTTLHAIEACAPRLVISAGTAGGFASRGGEIAKPYLASRVVFHDRRIDLPPFDRYGDGDYAVADLSAVATSMGLATGTVSTGNALDAPPSDVAKMGATETVAKDMEAAAVAWTCEQLDVPFTALKVITDLVDHHETAADQFTRNLALATKTLAQTAADLVAALQDNPLLATK